MTVDVFPNTSTDPEAGIHPAGQVPDYTLQLGRVEVVFYVIRSEMLIPCYFSSFT